MSNTPIQKSSFHSLLYLWYHANKRDLPWRFTTDSYTIWVSEVILQQTQVKQGLPYYYSFITAFPTVTDLALAHEDVVLAKWRGLGYYSRAINMHKTAKMVVDQYDGVFPTSYSLLINLPGVGSYTAAAVASFSSNEAVGVLDGNVFRFFSRLFGVDTPINSSLGKKEFQLLVDNLIDTDNSSLFNQAIMEFGALHCTSSNPNCANCPFALSCVAFSNGSILAFPVKKRANERRIRFFDLFFICNASSFVAIKRVDKDIWQNLYQLPLVERDENGVDISRSEILSDPFYRHFNQFQLMHSERHLLSHQVLNIKYYVQIIDSDYTFDFEDLDKSLFYNIKFADLEQYAFPAPITKFLKLHSSLE